MLGQRLERLVVIGRGVAGARPGQDGAFLHREGAIRHHEFRFEVKLGAQPIAFGAGAEGIVEGEQPRLDLVDGEARDRAGEALGEEEALMRVVLRLVRTFRGGLGRLERLVREFGDGKAVGQLECRLETVGEPCADVGLHHDAVHHDVDVVLELLVQRRGAVDLVELAVDLDAGEALLLQLGEFLAVLALAAAHDGGQQIEAGAVGQSEDTVDHLGDGLALDGKAGRWRIGHADAREKQAHVIVNFGDGAHGGARIAARRLLLDGDGGREAVDLVDVRLLHHLEELPGIGRKRLDIAALAFGIDRVEGERRFAGAREPGEHDQLVARKLQRDILQVVLTRTLNGQDFLLLWHRLSTRSKREHPQGWTTRVS